MSFSNKITHLIYDMDGVLLDTEPFYTQAIQEIVQKYGHDFDWSIKAKMLGRDSMDSARLLVKTLDLPITPEDYLAHREQKLQQLFPTAQPLPGAVALTEHFKKQGIGQAVATSSYQSNFDLKTTFHRAWFSLFDGIITGDHAAVKQGKPAPDIFLAAAQVLQASPEQCLVFEDAPAGMEAALAAGMSVVVIPDHHMDKRLYQRAHQILNSLEEFSPQLWGLPSFN
jgi:pseudouridine-5'-monophosphatase